MHPVFHVPRGGTFPNVFDTPFPSDMRLRADGHIDLTGYPTNGRSLVQTYVSTSQEDLTGFGTNSAIYFRFDGDPCASCWPTAAADTLVTGSPVFLVNIDPASPEYGARTPLRVKYDAGATSYLPGRLLALLPVPGFTLRPATRYAAVLTTAFTDAQGRPIHADAELESVKSTSVLADADLEHARLLHRPALDALTALGTDRAKIAGLALFTTQDPVAQMQAIYRYLMRQPVPVYTDIEYQPDGGTNAPNAYYFYGHYYSINFQQGLPPYVTVIFGVPTADSNNPGNIEFDSNGDPIPYRFDNQSVDLHLQFSLTVPRTPMPDGGWPVCTYAHGTGGSFHSHVDDGTAARVAGAGGAEISIDQVLHPTRDRCDTCDPTYFYNVYVPRAGRDNVRQSAADSIQLNRFIANLQIPANVSPTGQVITFNPSRRCFFGHSQGSETGPGFLATDPTPGAAVLSGAGGHFGLGFLGKQNPKVLGLTPLQLIEFYAGTQPGELDVFHPITTLVQMFIEPAEPLNYAPFFFRRPFPGNPRKNIFMSEGIGDTYSPNESADALAVALGVDLVTPKLRDEPDLLLSGRSIIDPPVTNNVTFGDGSVTGVLLQYTPVTDGHFVLFEVAAGITQFTGFLQSWFATGTATVPTP
jgi:hypothetical protein